MTTPGIAHGESKRAARLDGARNSILNLENYMSDFLVQAVPVMVDAWADILHLLRALAKLFGW